MFRLRLSLALLSALLGAGAHAEGTISAAGRISSLDGKGGCSASLVRPDVIVTAAHCGMRDRLVFRPGDGQNGETYAIVKLLRHPLYDQTSDDILWRLRFDIAVGKLAKPVPASRAVPFSFGDDAKVGESLFVVSWRNPNHDRPRQRICRSIDGAPGLVTIGCRVEGGESGAPVLRRKGDELELVAVVSSRFSIKRQSVGQASNVRLRLPPLLDLLDAESP